MSDVPLLEKLGKLVKSKNNKINDFNFTLEQADTIQLLLDDNNWLVLNDIVDALRKFQDSYMYDLCGSECDICKDVTAEFYDEETGKEYCFDCAINHFFGVLPKEKLKEVIFK
jgi:hypothetical protein